MKVGIIGARGLVGSAIHEHLAKSPDLELVPIQKENFEEIVKENINLDFLFNCNGNTFRYKAENDPAFDFHASVKSVMDSCLSLKTKKYIFISTIDVYPDISRRESTIESQTIDPQKLHVYGFHKHMAEMMVEKYTSNSCILRLGSVIGKKMVKGPLYDMRFNHELFFNQNSALSLVSDTFVGNVAEQIIREKLIHNKYNVCADPVHLKDVIQTFFKNKTIIEKSDKLYSYSIDNSKLKKEMEVPSPMSMIKEILSSDEHLLS